MLTKCVSDVSSTQCKLQKIKPLLITFVRSHAVGYLGAVSSLYITVLEIENFFTLSFQVV